MGNINVSIVGTANVTQMSSSFSRLQAQVAALNAQLESMIALSKGVDPIGYERMAQAAAQNSKHFRNAAASTGMFEVQQLKLNRATDDYVKNLKARNLSFRDMMRQQKVATRAYREQIAMEEMVVRQSQVGAVHGKQMLDVTYPKVISKDLDTAGRRMAWFNEQLKSGAHQMVNWGKNTQWAGRQLMVGFTIPVAAFGAAAGVMAYQVDKELTRIAKVYDTTHDRFSKNEAEVQAAIKETQELREQATQTAIDSARKYGAAGTDTLQVQAELAATGLQGAQLQEYTNEVVRIATLGELEYADAINATIALQGTFKMSSQELAETFNYMNAVENATSLQTKDFADAIPIAAGAMKAWGGDVKEMGTLLTAMRENGIGATEGANAIKATLQRLARPSKQIREEWQALTGTSIVEIVDQADSLTEVFSRINEETSKLAKKDQRKAFAGLFGSYQVSRMMAMTKGMEDLANGTGQVSKAAELAGADVGELADIADKELGDQAESVSGKWIRAFNEMKIQLSTMGKPFLQIATVVVKGISKIIKEFNQLPDLAKWFIAGSIGAIALAGPIIMLVGLFANLIGNGLKVGAALTGLFAKMNILDKESRAAALAAELEAAGFTSAAKAADLQRIAIEKLIASQQKAHALTFSQMSAAERKQYYQMTAGPNTRLSMQYAEEMQSSPMRFASPYDQAHAINNRIDKHNAQIIKDVKRDSKETSKHWRNIKVGAAAAAGSAALMFMHSEGTVGEIAKIVFYASLLGPLINPIGSLVSTMFKSANADAKRLNGTLKANLAVTEATAAASGAGAAASGAGGAAAANRAAKNAKNATTAATAATVAATRWGKVFGAVGGFFKTIGRGLGVLARAIGPAGWIIGGLTAAYAIWKKVKGDQEEAERKQKALIKEQVDGAKAIANAAKTYAQESGKAIRNLENISRTSLLPETKTNLDQRIDAYKTDQWKPYMDQFRAASTPREAAGNDMPFSESGQWDMALQRFYELQVLNKKSAKEATEEIRAMFMAAGASAWEADTYAKELRDTIGDIDKASIGTKVDILRNLTTLSRRGTSHEIAEMAPQVWMQFAHEFENAAAGYDAAQLVAPLSEGVKAEWMEAFDNLDDEIRAVLQEVGITSGEEFESFMRGLENKDPHALKLYDDIYQANDELTKKLYDSGMTFGDVFNEGSAGARAFEQGLIKTAKETLNLTGEYETFAELLQDPIFTSKITPVDESVVADFKERIANMRNYLNQPLYTGGADDNEENRLLNRNKLLTEMKQILHANGVETGKIKNLQQAYNLLVKLMNGELDTTKNKLNENKNAAMGFGAALRSSWDLGKEDMSQIMRESYGAVQQDIVDLVTEDFDRRMNASLESRQAMWDRKAEALQADLERRGRQLDKKWENRRTAAEEYWDRRTEGVQKAIEVEQKAEEQRQKMFDAEIARIQKLNEALNRNIDFNLALSTGDFDEAARIRNDAVAEADVTALERARDRGSRGSERRIDTLEGRQERIDKARDQHMKSLEQREDRERRHLEKVTKMREKALQRQTENDMKAQRKMWEAEKKNLDERSEMFLSWMGANERQVRRHANNVGGVYKKFGNGTLKPMGEEWSQFFNDRLYRHIQLSTNRIRSDKMWEQLGKRSVREMLRGIGFKGFGEFRRMLTTGEVPDTFGKSLGKDTGQHPTDPKQPTRHTGGWVNDSPGSRKGVARSLKGLHPSEQIVRAQKGEFIVNRRSSEKYADLLEGINKDKYPEHGQGGIGSGGIPAAIFAGAINSAIAKKATDTLEGAINSKAMGLMSALYSGAIGDHKYNLGPVKPWVEEAAYYLGNKYNIATIGGVASRTGYSEHPLGRALDFMVSDERGTALANEVIKRHRALDAMYVIWRQRIHSFDSRGWRQMEDRGSATANHFDHVHVSFNATGDTGDLPDLAGGAFVQGKGGRHKPIRFGVSRGMHDTSTAYPAVDMATRTSGHPVYAVGSGTISSSYDIRGHEPRAPHGGLGYRSYGRVITLALDGGGSVLYGHLSQRFAQKGKRVKGGALIGKSGDTGYSTGPHLHFGASNGNPYAYLKKGGTIKRDGTPAILHKGERVLTDKLTNKLDSGIDAIFHAANRAKKNANKNKKSRNRGGYAMDNGPLGLGTADSPYQWIMSEIIKDARRRSKVKKGVKNSVAGSMDAVNDSGRRSTVRMGTLNTKVGTSAKATMSDLARLIKMADVLSLTEVKNKFNALRGFLSKRGWGLHGGKSRDARGSVLAWNKAKYNASEFGTRQLGKRKADILGGRELRYANYALLKDRKTGRSMWQVAAHTVPTPGFSKAHRRLFYEQWGNIDKLVTQLRGSGAPVFLSGDLNERESRPWFRTPEGLGGKQGLNVDWIFHDKRMAEFMGRQVVKGMHTDHAGALLAQYNIPGLARGGHVRWDNTLANLHKDETVLTADLSRQLREGIGNFANGGQNVYDIDIDARGLDLDENKLADVVITKIERAERRKPGSRRGKK